MTLRHLLALVTLLALAPATLAQDNLRAPGQVEITADKFEINEGEHRATFTGNVLVKHPTVTVWAPEVVVLYGSAGISDIRSFEALARDGVAVRLQTQDQQASGNRAEFDPKTQILRLTGDVVVNNGAGTLSGPSLVVDLEKNTSVFTGGEGGRVTGVFGAP